MLKLRMIGVIIIKQGIAVQSIGFNRYLPVGNPAIAVEYLNRWGIDEITLLDIDATPASRGPSIEAINAYARFAHVPLSVGGGITSVEDIKRVVKAGADKVVINYAAVKNPTLITEGAKFFGNQCMVVSIDARRKNKGNYEVFINSGRDSTGLAPDKWAQKAEKYGAGEIFINSIDRDGTKNGYDLELARQVVEAVNIPVVICGGVGRPEHFSAAITLGVSGVAAANFFHYTECSVLVAKANLKRDCADIRLDSYATFEGFKFDPSGRAAKKEDAVLEKLRFEYIPEEVI